MFIGSFKFIIYRSTLQLEILGIENHFCIGQKNTNCVFNDIIEPLKSHFSGMKYLQPEELCKEVLE